MYCCIITIIALSSNLGNEMKNLFFIILINSLKNYYFL